MGTGKIKKGIDQFGGCIPGIPAQFHGSRACVSGSSAQRNVQPVSPLNASYHTNHGTGSFQDRPLLNMSFKHGMVRAGCSAEFTAVSSCQKGVTEKDAGSVAPAVGEVEVVC